jgi:ketosteroid isomerase-like protein
MRGVARVRAERRPIESRMRAGVTLAGVLLVVACGRSPAPSVTPQPASRDSQATFAAAQEIHHLQAEWRQALVAKDTTFFARTLMDDFLLTGDEDVLAKAEYIRKVIESTDTLPGSRPVESTVRVHGDVAVVTGLIDNDVPGSPVPLQMRYTEVWLKRDGRWQAFHGHYNPLLRSLMREHREGSPLPQKMPTVN